MIICIWGTNLTLVVSRSTDFSPRYDYYTVPKNSRSPYTFKYTTDAVVKALAFFALTVIKCDCVTNDTMSFELSN